MDAAELILYVSVGAMIYFLIMEISKPKQGSQKIMNWIFIIAILLFIAWVGYSYYRSQQKLGSVDITGGDTNNRKDDYDDMEVDNEPIVNTKPPLVYNKVTKNINIRNSPTSNGSQLKYDDFKNWYLQSQFLEEFHKSIIMGFRLKYNKLNELRKKYLRDLKILGSGNDLGNIFTPNSIDENKTIRKNIEFIETLLDEIKSKLKTTTIKSVKAGLISCISDPVNGIETLIGREDIKDFLALQLYSFSRNPRIFLSNFQNMALYGHAGVGKTKLAHVIGHVYASCGILIRNHVHVITKQSLTTSYVNESGRKTRNILMSNLESVVFIDEAYDLGPNTTLIGTLDHGTEAIAELVNFIDKMIGLSIIIVAGYKDEMEARFMTANEGLPRRFPHKITLEPYSSDELTYILLNCLKNSCPDLIITPEQGNYIYTMVDYLNNKGVFKNQGGDMLNLSSFIARLSYGSPNKTWNRDYEELVKSGINSFLYPAGKSVEVL